MEKLKFMEIEQKWEHQKGSDKLTNKNQQLKVIMSGENFEII